MAAAGDVSTGEGWELRCGRWQDVLADVECDALITDPPYSERTHKGHNRGVELCAYGYDSERAGLDYECLDARGILEITSEWSPRTRRWLVAMIDCWQLLTWRDALEAQGRLVFTPVPYVAPGSRVRLQGDGPSSWTVWTLAARPRTLEGRAWRTLPGAYVLPPGEAERNSGHWMTGAKPLWIMRELVRDYSNPGDVIVDPFAGTGTTLLAAALEGRHGVGAELNPKTYEDAVVRLRYGKHAVEHARRGQLGMFDGM